MVNRSTGDVDQVVSSEEQEYCKKIPYRIRAAIQAHARHGQKAGDFVECLLSNDFTGAVARADSYNSKVLKEIVIYLLNNIPGPCWGSKEQVRQWRLQQHSEQKEVFWN